MNGLSSDKPSIAMMDSKFNSCLDLRMSQFLRVIGLDRYYCYFLVLPPVALFLFIGWLQTRLRHSNTSQVMGWKTILSHANVQQKQEIIFTSINMKLYTYLGLSSRLHRMMRQTQSHCSIRSWLSQLYLLCRPIYSFRTWLLYLL